LGLQRDAFGNHLPFFLSLEAMLSGALDGLQRCTEQFRQSMRPRLMRLSQLARNIGWGYGDFVNDVIAGAVKSDVLPWKRVEAELDPHRQPLDLMPCSRSPARVAEMPERLQTHEIERLPVGPPGDRGGAADGRAGR
jgi:hypothetical protein